MFLLRTEAERTTSTQPTGTPVPPTISELRRERIKMSDTNARIPIILCAGANGRAVVFGWVDTEPVPGDAVSPAAAERLISWK